MRRHRGWRFIIKPAGSKIRGRPAVIKRVQQRSAPHRKTLAPRKAGALLSAATTARLNVSSRLAPLKRPRHPGARARRRPPFSRGSAMDGSHAIPSRPAMQGRVQCEGRYMSAAEKRGIIAGSRESPRRTFRVNHLIVSENRGWIHRDAGRSRARRKRMARSYFEIR